MTGPRTAEGKAISSRNALTLGLYTRNDYVKPEERELYQEFRQGMLAELTPEGLLEESFAVEIVSATWRLRRCSLAEADLEAWDDTTEKTRRGIDRARAAAHCALNRAIRNLRQLQTERITREQIGLDKTGSGSNCKTDPQASPQTPRNAPCPCKSGQKFKRCCGREAPPLLGKAA